MAILTRSAIATSLRQAQLRLPQRTFQRTRTSGNYRTPKPYNEPNMQYAPGSPELQQVSSRLAALRDQLPMRVPALGGASSSSQNAGQQQLTSTYIPSEHGTKFSESGSATRQDVTKAIEDALAAKQEWQDMSFHDRASIFLRAADLVAGKYRFELTAATMLGQGKNPWQAEIDLAELADFYRFNVAFAQEIYDKQPERGTDGHHGRTDWRPLEGFTYAVSPFNFTAIGGNLISAPALLGNVVVWKPAPMTAHVSHVMHQILLEAGLPPGVIQLVNGDAEMITDVVFQHREFSALAFIGSSAIFRSLWKKAAENVEKYREYPRMIAECSGKNFHLLHPSADHVNAAKHTVRAAFEYAGQKCSACSRIYLPESLASSFFDEMKHELSRIKVGPPEEFTAFTGPVINRNAFDRLTKAIDEANGDERLETIVGGTYDGSTGYYVHPTIYRTTTPDHPLLNTELFGPVLAAYVYPDHEFDKVLDQIDAQGGNFALTGNIFSQDQKAIRKAENRLRYAAGNFYINCKTTAAVIGQSPGFGGSRSSGTSDRAGSTGMLMRFLTPRSLKEEYPKLDEVLYPSNIEG